MEREIRLGEVQILENYLNAHQITSDPVRRYVDSRRAAILAEYPEILAGTDDKPANPPTPSDQPPTDQPPTPSAPEQPGSDQPAKTEAPVTTAAV